MTYIIPATIPSCFIHSWGFLDENGMKMVDKWWEEVGKCGENVGKMWNKWENVRRSGKI